MENSLLITFISAVTQLFTWIVFASAILSFFLPPYHPVREALNRIVDPFLAPIRSMMPETGAIDFSPLVLILVVQLIARILISIFFAIS